MWKRYDGDDEMKTFDPRRNVIDRRTPPQKKLENKEVQLFKLYLLVGCSMFVRSQKFT